MSSATLFRCLVLVIAVIGLASILCKLPCDKVAEGFQRLSFMQVEPLSQVGRLYKYVNTW